MNGRVFLDSNILLYTLGADSKAAQARDALKHAHVISVQVLNEFANVARRKKLLTAAELRQFTEPLKQIFQIEPITLAIHESALNISGRYGFGFYDSLIIASALQAQCDTLYSEDLQQDQLIEKRLRVVNPFV